MISVETLLKDETGILWPLAQWEESLAGQEVLEGAILLSVDDSVIFDRELWDDIDYLWGLLGEAAVECRRSGKALTHFPGQPIDIILEMIDPRLVLIRVSHLPIGLLNAAVADADELWAAIRDGLTDFVGHLSRLEVDDVEVFDPLLAEVGVW